MASQQPPQTNFDAHRPVFNNAFPAGPPLHSWSNTGTSSPMPTPTSASGSGRKRSRDEAAFEDHDYFPAQMAAVRTSDPVDTSGLGMIANGMDGAMAMESQTDTWPEHSMMRESTAVAMTDEQDRPPLRSAKSQRLDLSATPAIAEEVKLGNGKLAHPLTAAVVDTAPGPREPTIDDYTRYLGIGWSAVEANVPIQAALRGWTRYIEKHYPLHDVHIRLESRGLNSYLVEAREGYYLFADDLKRCQMVSANLDQTFRNLRGPVPVFEGPGTMEAGESPKGTISLDGSLICDDGYALGTNGTDEAVFEAVVPVTTTTAPAIEMDLS